MFFASSLQNYECLVIISLDIQVGSPFLAYPGLAMGHVISFMQI